MLWTLLYNVREQKLMNPLKLLIIAKWKIGDQTKGTFELVKYENSVWIARWAYRG